MKLALTGATGYVGQWVADAALRDGHKLLLTVRASSDVSRYKSHPRVEILRIESEDFGERLMEFSPEVALHIAAAMPGDATAGDAYNIFHSNVLFPATWLAHLVSSGCTKFINTATYWENSDRPPFGPINPYAASKAAFRVIVDGYVQQRKLSAISLRLFDIYGPQDARPKIFNLAIEAARGGKPLPASPGEQTLYFVHVIDVVRAYFVAIERSRQLPVGVHEMFDVRGQGVTLRQAVAELQQKLSSSLEINWGAKAYHPDQIMAPQLLDILPNWINDYSLDRGLSELVKAYDEEKN